MNLEGGVGWIGESKAGVINIKNVVYQVWDVKSWDQVGVPDIGDIPSIL